MCLHWIRAGAWIDYNFSIMFMFKLKLTLYSEYMYNQTMNNGHFFVYFWWPQNEGFSYLINSSLLLLWRAHILWSPKICKICQLFIVRVYMYSLSIFLCCKNALVANLWAKHFHFKALWLSVLVIVIRPSGVQFR